MLEFEPLMRSRGCRFCRLEGEDEKVYGPMEKLFHSPDPSCAQEIEHFEPAVKTSPGPGAVGVTAPRANRESNRSASERDIMLPATVFSENESRFQPKRKTN
jgi:hypothetical protein